MEYSLGNTYTARWGFGPLNFELRTNHEETALQIGRVMAPWIWNAPGDADAEARFGIKAERQADGCWIFRGSQPEAAGVCASMAELTRSVEADAILAILGSANLFLSIHGALVARGDRGMLIVGPSRSGKSSLACALWLAGWSLLCDDVTLLDHDDGAAKAMPVPRRVDLRSSSRPLFPAEKWEALKGFSNYEVTTEGVVFHPPTLRPAGESVTLAGVIFLQRNSGVQAGALCRIHPAEAVLAASPYTNLIKSGGLGECLHRLTPLLADVPIFDLGRDELASMTKRVNELFESLEDTRQ